MNKFSRIVISSLFLCFSSAYADIERVSVSSSGEPGNEISFNSGISTSADGRYVAFGSNASNLVPGDTNGMTDVFVHDRQTGTTERVSVTSTGEQGVNSLHNPRGASDPKISADGRFVVFQSDAINLVPDDVNGTAPDIFLHDRQNGVTKVVSFYTNGEQLTYGSYDPSINADGQFVAYVAGRDLFVHDLVTGIVGRESESSTGERGNSTTFKSSISADGRFVAFMSYASNLVTGDTNNRTDIFVRDRITGLTERVSKSSNGEQGNDFSNYPSISADGQFVVFNSDANNLVSGDVNGNATDIFVHNRQTGITEIVSVSSSGEQGNNNRSASYQPSISADGRFVAFDNRSTNLVPSGATIGSHTYIHDRQTRLTEIVRVLANGVPSARPTISADGHFVAFESVANNLVPGDTNNNWDIFITDNPLIDSGNNLVIVEKLINNEARETLVDAAKLSAGTLYRQSYKVTNDSPNRIYQVNVFEEGNLVCNFFALNPGQTRQRCDTLQTVLDGEQYVQVTATAKISGSGDALTSSTDAYYTGLNVSGELRVTHRINNNNADSLDNAPMLGSSQATVSYKVENTGEVELYQVKTYHDPVSPVNSGWALQCVLGSLKPGQIRYCKRDIAVTESGLNQAMGRVQGRNAISSATDVVNASNPTYFIVP